VKWVLALVAAAACAHAQAGERRVIEGDLGEFTYRRFQKVEDIEIEMDGNPGVGFTAVYQHRDTVGRPQVPRSAVAVAFVTEYQRAEGLARLLPDKLERLKGYRVKKDKQVYLLWGEAGDSWAFWPSKQFIVKVGGPETRDPPKALVKAYLEAYPSDWR